MTQMTPGPINRTLWTDPKFQFLEGLRQIGDPEADEAVRRFVERYGPEKAVEEATRFMTSLTRIGWPSLEEARRSLRPPPPDEATEAPRPQPEYAAALEAFLDKHTVLPSWANRELIIQGQKVFERHGPMALAALLCASLPECYSHKNGALVLWHTQRLKDHAVRRIYETAKMILEVMTPDALEPGGKAALTAVKTRLLHAVMRYLVLTQPPREPKNLLSLADELLYSQWDVKQWGVPINQEDNAFTLLTFSYVILRSWKRMKLPISKDEEVAYQHCWNVVGHYLGIRPDLYATDWDDAELMWRQLQAHQQAPSDEGRGLTQALTGVMQEIVPPEYLAQRIEYTLMRFFMSSHTADVLGLPPEELFDHVIKLGIDLWKLLNQGANVVQNLTTRINQHLPIPIPGFIPRAIDAFAWRAGAVVTNILVNQLRPSPRGSEHAPKDARQNLREKLRGRRPELPGEPPRTVEDLVDQMGRRFAERLGRPPQPHPASGPAPAMSERLHPPPVPGAPPLPPRPPFEIPAHLKEAWGQPLRKRMGRDFTPLS